MMSAIRVGRKGGLVQASIEMSVTLIIAREG